MSAAGAEVGGAGTREVLLMAPSRKPASVDNLKSIKPVVCLMAVEVAGGSCDMQSGLGRQGVAAFTASADIAPAQMEAKASCISSQHKLSGASPNTCSSAAGRRFPVSQGGIVPRDNTRVGGRAVGYCAHGCRHLGDGGALGAGVAPPEPASVQVGERRQPAAGDFARADARPSLRSDCSQPQFPSSFLMCPLATIMESCGINQG